MNTGKNEDRRFYLSSLETINVYFLIRSFKEGLGFGEGLPPLLLIGKVFENVSQEEASKNSHEEKPSQPQRAISPMIFHCPCSSLR
jgi:hypothetical protein